MREKILKFTSKFEKSAEKTILYGKTKFDKATNRVEDVSNINIDLEMDSAINQVVIYNERLTKKKVITLKRFSWKMFFYGWMGGPFIRCGSFFIGFALIAFSIFYAYNFYKITKQFGVAIQNLQIDENTQSGIDLRNQLKVQSSSIPDVVALVISVICGFFGEAVCLQKYLKNGWRLAPTSEENKSFLRKKYFIKTENLQ